MVSVVLPWFVNLTLHLGFIHLELSVGPQYMTVVPIHFPITPTKAKTKTYARNWPQVSAEGPTF